MTARNWLYKVMKRRSLSSCFLLLFQNTDFFEKQVRAKYCRPEHD